MAKKSNSGPNPARIAVAIRGAVQGVGFRPFIYRLATEMKLAGWVRNSPQGVLIDVEGNEDDLRCFVARLQSESPERSFIQSLETTWLDPCGHAGFEIRESNRDGERLSVVMPDIATCSDCLSEIFDPGNRRYLYPFTNCTQCGPRYSIIRDLPYDRRNTTMRDFVMCPECQREYEDPVNRRYHAQPNACPVCGPSVSLCDGQGNILVCGQDAIEATAKAVLKGLVVAVKGLGGFHLVTDATSDKAVLLLRERKHREEKPFAVMFPDLASVEAVCEVGSEERRLLQAPESPIVLLRRRADGARISDAVAPGNPYLGVMLPYTPLHHILLREAGRAIVATSGNASDEPICIDEEEALSRLSGLADLFLLHNRPIERHADDSIVRVIEGREMVLRRARGYAPLPLPGGVGGEIILAVGAHLKNTVALTVGADVVVSQHIGDLDNVEAYRAFEKVIEDLENLYGVNVAGVAEDKHPDYLSTKYARRREGFHESVQHHHAHIAACMAENRIEGPVLGVAWDGTGYGEDGTVWGGEFLVCDKADFDRAAHFRTFPLPGGEAAVKESRRSALGLLYEMSGGACADLRRACTDAFSRDELKTLTGMMSRRINAPFTSSVGRLFDAVSSLAGIRQVCTFEGQAAMELEFAMGDSVSDEAYPMAWTRGRRGQEDPWTIDWEAMIAAILVDLAQNTPTALISLKFHNSLAATVVEAARRLSLGRVALSGGCFQNAYLLTRTIRALRAEGYHAYWHQRVPPNDGGISFGQAVVAARRRKES
ncbi:MAG: carbamoyltransferase HypF [Verrucomicrobia bacterium]|nr:carbamoyltransferase HypF [Verrucomicrobiota bacterium]